MYEYPHGIDGMVIETRAQSNFENFGSRFLRDHFHDDGKMKRFRMP
jgi:hypothetical protein